jgi:hypothetical protein
MTSLDHDEIKRVKVHRAVAYIEELERNLPQIP